MRRVRGPGRAATCRRTSSPARTRRTWRRSWARTRPAAVLRKSGLLVEGAVAALGQRQPAALGGDRTALDAVRSGHVDVDGLGAGLELVLRDLVDLRRAHRDPGLGDLLRDAVLDPHVVRGIVAGRIAREEHRRELVEDVGAVGLRILLGGAADLHRNVAVRLDLLVAGRNRAPREQPGVGDAAERHEPLVAVLAHVPRAVEVRLDL